MTGPWGEPEAPGPEASTPRTPRRVAQGVITLVAAAALGVWFAHGGGLGAAGSRYGDSVGVLDMNGDVDYVWGAEGLSFVSAPARMEPGTHTIALEVLADDLIHNVVIEGVNGERPVVQARHPGRYVNELTLEAGSYVYWCDVGGHRQAGMHGTISVAES